MAIDRETQVRERRIVALIGAIQFVNILDFVMVMPMGPDFAKGLHIDLSNLGAIGGAYTLSAAVSGVVGSLFLDRFDRRTALAWAMFGLVIGTVAGGFAWDLPSLIGARVLAGFFGGPASALSMSIIADTIAPERRGRAMGAVMGAFSVASVIGIPVGLELAHRGGWRLPFFAVAGLGIIVNAFALFYLPAMRGHLDLPQEKARGLSGLLRQFSNRDAWLCYGMAIAAMGSAFMVIPNLSAYTQHNLGLPRQSLGLLYLWGGVVSFVVMRVSGWIVDRWGALGVSIAATLVYGIVLWQGIWQWTGNFPVLLVFVPFFIATAMRNVSYNTLVSKVPTPANRARFMSALSAVQHLSTACGAMASSQILSEGPDHRLIGMPQLAAISFAMSLTLPILMFLVEAQVARRAQQALTSLQPAAASR